MAYSASTNDRTTTPSLVTKPSPPRGDSGSWMKKAFDTLLSIVIPSSSKAFQDKRQEHINEGKIKSKRFRDELDNLRTIGKHYVRQRREAAHNLAKCIDPDSESFAVTDPNVLDDLMRIHREKVAICTHLESQISKLEKAIDKITEMAATESCLRITGYKGIKDWSSETWEAYSDLVQAISTICFVGAGLTYASIFSATRGDLGLMAWAFSLFIVGMIITVIVRVFLVQCSRLEDYPFSTQRLWEVLLGISIYSACLAVITAICLLLLTVLQLRPTPAAPLTFAFSPRPPATLALSAIGVGMFLGLVVIGVFVLANGANALLWRRRALRTRENEKRRRRMEEDGLV